MKPFLRNVAMLSLMRLMMDLLLPEGAMRRICDVIVGLVLMLSMLGALQQLLHGGFG